MQDRTGASPATDTPTAYGWCAWHQGHARGVRLVQLQDQGSGRGAPGLFACRPCRAVYDLVPFADR